MKHHEWSPINYFRGDWTSRFLNRPRISQKVIARENKFVYSILREFSCILETNSVIFSYHWTDINRFLCNNLKWNRTPLQTDLRIPIIKAKFWHDNDTMTWIGQFDRFVFFIKCHHFRFMKLPLPRYFIRIWNTTHGHARYYRFVADFLFHFVVKKSSISTTLLLIYGSSLLANPCLEDHCLVSTTIGVGLVLRNFVP